MEKLSNEKFSRMKQAFRAMKLTCVLLMVSVMGVLANRSYSQNKTLNLSIKDQFIIETAHDVFSTESQQQSTVSGIVTDEVGEPLPGVTVIVKGSTQGTATDIDGTYTIPNIPENAILQFSFVGMQLQEIAVGNQTTINVIMALDAIQIDEIVAVGYGTMRKSDLTGSVTRMTTEELIDRPVLNVAKALQNKVSGLQIVMKTTGEPGGQPRIRIRGVNSINTNADPLFVVDGIIGVENAMENINPNDIESIDVLKDASATAIYGARGANGVIIITTKRGEAGDLKINYSGSATVGTMLRHNYAVDGDQFMYIYEQAFRNTPKFGTLAKHKDFRGPGAQTSWSEMPHLFEQVAKGGYFLELQGNDGNYYKPRFSTQLEDYVFSNSFSHSNHVDLNGGTEKAKYTFSLGNVHEDGLFQDSYLDRINTRMTLDFELSKWLTMSANLGYTNVKRNWQAGDIMRNVSEYFAILPPYQYPNEEKYGDYAGKWPRARDFNVGEDRKGATMMLDQEDGYYRDNQFTGSIRLAAQITDDLSFRTDFSVDQLHSMMRRSYGTYEGRERGDARGHHWARRYWQNESYFNYAKDIGDHSITGLLGLSWSRRNWDYLYSRGNRFSSNFYKWNNLGAGSDTPEVDTGNGQNSLNSYFARATYSYQHKYMLTATGRIDGSSKFGKNEKYGFFPSLGAAWRISQEEFLVDSETLSNLKLRFSLGKTGNQEIGSYVTQRYINSTNVLFGDGLHSGLYPGSTGNEDLKWETTDQYDIGIDIGFLNNRISAIMDFYYKKTTDMLFDLPLPQSTTTGNAFVNYGSVENKGFEFTLQTVNIDTKRFYWDSRLTLSFNKNEIIELGPTGADIYQDTGAGNGTHVYRVGEPIGSFWGLNRMGVWGTEEAVEAARYGKVPGDLKFEDKNQDGKIELISDGMVIGKGFPDYYGGFNNTFRYGNWDANIDFQFVGGVDKAIVHESGEDRQLVNGMMNRVLNAWRPDHQENTMIAQVRAGNAGGRYDSYPDTHMMYDGSYIRGKTATIGYTFTDFNMTKGIERLRVYFSTENFLLWTKEKQEGYDPEGSSVQRMRDNVPNIDKYQYPTPTNFTLGVNVSF